MNIPEFMYGPYAEVKKRSNKILKQLEKGASWEGEVACLPMLDTKDMEGNIVMEGPAPFVKNQMHFNMYVFLSQLREYKSLKIREDEILNKHLETSWGTLSLMSGSGGRIQMFFVLPDRHIPFIKSVIKYWDIYLSEGKNFSDGGSSTHRIWDIITNIKFVLARRKVPNEILHVPLPNNDLEALVKRYNLI